MVFEFSLIGRSLEVGEGPKSCIRGKTLFAHAGILTNAYAGPEFEPFECEAPVWAEESDGQSLSSAENVRLAKGFITAIDFEVVAALSLCGGWHADWKDDIYLVRTLERIAGHLKALKAIQAMDGQSLEANSRSASTEPIAANEHTVLVMKPR